MPGACQCVIDGKHRLCGSEQDLAQKQDGTHTANEAALDRVAQELESVKRILRSSGGSVEDRHNAVHKAVRKAAKHLRDGRVSSIVSWPSHSSGAVIEIE